AIADILAENKIGLEQGLDHLTAFATLLSETDQAARAEGVRRLLNLVEVECEPLGLSGRANDVVDSLGLAVVAELRGEVFAAVHAGGMYSRMELERAPTRREPLLRAYLQRTFQAALADPAPGTDDICENVETHGASLKTLLRTRA